MNNNNELIHHTKNTESISTIVDGGEVALGNEQRKWTETPTLAGDLSAAEYVDTVPNIS